MRKLGLLKLLLSYFPSRRRHLESGMSVAGLLIVSFAGLMVSLFLTKVVSNSQKSVKATLNMDDLNGIRQTLRSSLSCEATLGAALPSTVPCAGPYTLRRADGSVLPTQFGSPATWEIRNKCDSNKLLIEVHRIGKTGTGMSNQTLIRTDWFDLFNGAGELCRPYFSGATCPAGQMYIGMAGSVPVCGNAPKIWTAAFCGTGGEVLIPGSSGNTYCSLSAMDDDSVDSNTSIPPPGGYKFQLLHYGPSIGWKMSALKPCSQVACVYACVRF